MNEFQMLFTDARPPKTILGMVLKSMLLPEEPTSSPLPINAMTGNVIPWGERVFEDSHGALYYPESRPDDEDLHEYVLTIDRWLVHIGYWGGVIYE